MTVFSQVIARPLAGAAKEENLSEGISRYQT